MRRSALFLRSMTVAVLAAAAALIPATPAVAGGPTSVLLVSPVHQRTASLYYSDAGYAVLSSALGDADPAHSDAATRSIGPGSGAVVTVTWLIHDVTVWRVDQVFLDGHGVPWVATSVSEDPGLGEPGLMHRASQPKRLLDLLDRLGLFDPSEGVVLPAKELPANAVPEEPTGARQAAGPPAPGDSGWLWLLIGLAGGAIIATGLRPLVVGVRSRGTARGR